ncbi:MAG: hypothetical protein R3D89_13445 [Sphingomonadaceae bacterium]
MRETSLTLDGVSVVVDAGLSRRAEFDRAAGVSRLVTHRASRASAAQRAGRAARQGPGVAYRLWEEAAHTGRAAFDPPEIETSDLAPLVLSMARWGSRDPASAAWLDPPPEASVASARERLLALGALDGEGAITAFGEQVAALPMSPEQAAMVLFGARAGQAEGAARLALLLQERGLGGRGEDLLQRLDRWNGDNSPRAKASRQLASRWAERAGKACGRGMWARRSTPACPLPSRGPTCWQSGVMLQASTGFRLAGAGTCSIPPRWHGQTGWPSEMRKVRAGRAHYRRGGAGRGEIEAAFADRIERRSLVRWNESEGRIEARLEKSLGAIVLSSGPDPEPDPEAVRTALLQRGE